MKFNQSEILALKEANEILKLHDLSGSCINADHAPHGLVEWVNSGALGIETMNMSPIEIIVAFYEQNPDYARLPQSKGIDVYQLGHQPSTAYFSKEQMNEEQLKDKEIFQHFHLSAFFYILFDTADKKLKWRLFSISIS